MKRDYRLVAKDGVAPASELERDYKATLRRRGTPQTSIDAIMFCIRERGPEALLSTPRAR